MGLNMSILLDLSIVILMVISIITGYKSGIIKSIVGLLGAILATILSAYIANIIANFVYSSIISVKITESINTIINQYGIGGLTRKVEFMFSSFPAILYNMLIYMGITKDYVVQVINSTQGNIGLELSNMLKPAIVNVIRVIVMSLVFMLVMAIVKIITKNMRTVLKLPGLKQIDKFLGAVFGAFKCIVLLIFVIFIIKLIIPMMTEIPPILSIDTIESTILFKVLYDNNILYELAGSFHL